MEVYVGADWDSQFCVVVVRCGDAMSRTRVERNPGSIVGLMSRLEQEHGAKPVRVAIEDGDELFARLWLQAGATVHCINPLKSKRYGEARCTSGASDDRRSAENLCLMAMDPAVRGPEFQDECAAMRALRMLANTQEMLAKEVVRATNRLRSILRQDFPALEAALGRKLETTWSLRLINAAPTALAYQELTEEERADAFRGATKKTRRAIHEAITSFGVLSGEADLAARVRTRILVNQLQCHRDQTKKLAEKIEAMVVNNETAEKLTAAPGIGRVIALGLLLVFGKTKGGRDDASVLSGVAPVTVKSGAMGRAKPLVKMRRNAGSAEMRVGMLLAAQAVRRLAWAKAQYAHYMAKGHKSSAAYRRVARSYLRILQAMLRTGELYDEDRYIAALKSKGVVWAMAL